MNSNNQNETPEGIVYFYYKDENGKEYSIDFGSEFKYNFDSKNNVLNVEKNINHIPFFYNENDSKVIQNLSLIVGANGSGKTTVLKKLIELCSSNMFFGSDEQVIIVHRTNLIYQVFISNTLKDVKIPHGYDSNIVDLSYKTNQSGFSKVSVGRNIPELASKYNLVLLSNVFDDFYLDQSSDLESSVANVFDLSLNARICSLHKEKKAQPNLSFFSTYKRQENDKLIKYINSKSYQELFPFDRAIKFIRCKENINNALSNSAIKQKNKFYNKFIKLSEDCLKTKLSKDNTKFVSIEYIARVILLFDFISISIIDKLDQSIENKLTEFFALFLKEESIDKSIEIGIELLNKIDSEVDSIWMKKVLDNLEGVSITSFNYDLRFDNFKDFQEFYLIFNQKTYYNQYEWFQYDFFGLSSGQLAILSLFANLYSIKDKIQSNNKKLLISIDEIDLYLHPQWQKQIISQFIKFCNTVFHDKKVQIIMTTNNAIPVSDVLKYNVVLLGQDQKQHLDNYRNTFGGNIFNLLNDTFFIQDGFIGEFAQMKIQELIDLLYEKDIMYLVEHMDEIEKRINLVGEDLIKNKLLEILEQRLSANLLSIKNTLNKLEDRISNLEQRKNE